MLIKYNGGLFLWTSLFASLILWLYQHVQESRYTFNSLNHSLHYFVNISYFTECIIYRTVLEYYSGSPDKDAYGTVILILKF